MTHKKIAIMTTGGDCSGINIAISRIIDACSDRKWDVVGILDGTDGLYANPPKTVKLSDKIFDFCVVLI